MLNNKMLTTTHTQSKVTIPSLVDVVPRVGYHHDVLFSLDEGKVFRSHCRCPTATMHAVQQCKTNREGEGHIGGGVWGPLSQLNLPSGKLGGYRAIGGQSQRKYRQSRFKKPLSLVVLPSFSAEREGFRKRVGGQRGLARGNPSCATSGLFSVSLFLCLLRRRGTHFWRIFWALFGGLFVANPPANPFSKPLKEGGSIRKLKKAVGVPKSFWEKLGRVHRGTARGAPGAREKLRKLEPHSGTKKL